MMKPLLLSALLFSLGNWSYANAEAQLDEFFTSLTVYSLIIGIYMLYWFRQKA